MSRFHISVAMLALLALSRTGDTLAADPIYRFDMGTADSPVAKDFQRVDETSRYSPNKGFGWLGDAGRESFYRTEISPMVLWRHEPELTVVDGVQSKDDLEFQVDVPNGRYTVEVYVGDLGGYVPEGMGRFLDTGKEGEASGGPGGPRFSMGLASGDRTIAVPIEARTLPHRGVAWPSSMAFDFDEPGISNPKERVYIRLGNYNQLHFDEQVTDGKLKLRLFGDDSKYQAGLKQLKAIEDRRDRNQMAHIVGGPFSANSVLAVVVRPAIDAPFKADNGKLSTKAGENSTLGKFVKAFNAAEFAAAGRAINELPQSTFEERYARILARMWLVGHPNHWREEEAMPQIESEIDAALKTATPAQKAELLALQEDISDLKYGIMNFNQRTSDGEEVVPSMNRAEAYFARSQPDDPFYWKSQQYRARIWYSMDPNHNAQFWTKAEGIMQDLEKVYPENRWVRYYLHEDASGWPVVDYRLKTRGAPEWASELHNFYNRILDLSEWWITERQDPENGAIGGEWGDDVELFPLFGYTAFISPDASPTLLSGSRLFGEGVWLKSGIIDDHNGFFHITSDAEHASEFTGNLLGMMLQLFPGDPVYVERSLKTGKLMRDVFMGQNSKGQRLMRSSFLGAFHVPNRDFDVDAAITGRAMNPAWNVLELNRNPEIMRLAIEYADTLYDLAMSNAKGKPVGVLPGPIIYDTGELGTPGSDKWWVASEEYGPFAGMFSFPDYYWFRMQILQQAFRLTGDQKYLEPLKLQAEFVQKVLPDYKELAKKKKPKGHQKDEDEGSEQWVARKLAATNVVELWEDLQTELGGTSPETTGVLLNKDEVAAEAHELAQIARDRWPMMTDDATMTDRVAYAKSYNSSVWYSGARIIAQQFVPCISYEGTGRDFAALVMRHNPKYMKLLYYGFQDEPKNVQLRFWELEPRGTYRLVGGPDKDGDDSPDTIEFEQEFVLTEPSGGIELQLAPGQTYAFEIRQTRPGQSEVSAADPAISSEDILYDPRGHVLVDVHNIGNLPAKDVTVDFYEGDPADGGKLLGSTIVSNVDPPNALEPQVVRTGIQWNPKGEPREITVVLDGDNQIKELFERNNKATAVIPKKE